MSFLGNLFNKVARDPINQLTQNFQLNKYKSAYDLVPQQFFYPQAPIQGLLQPQEVQEIKTLLMVNGQLTPPFNSNELIPNFVKAEAQKQAETTALYFSRFASVGVAREHIVQMQIFAGPHPRYVCYEPVANNFVLIIQDDASQSDVLNSPVVVYGNQMYVSQRYLTRAQMVLQALRPMIRPGVSLTCMGMGHGASVAQVVAKLLQLEQIQTRSIALGPVPCFGIQTAVEMGKEPSHLTLVAGRDFLTRMSNHCTRTLQARCGLFETSQPQLFTEQLSEKSMLPDSLFVGGRIIWLLPNQTLLATPHQLGEAYMLNAGQVDYTPLVMAM